MGNTEFLNNCYNDHPIKMVDVEEKRFLENDMTLIKEISTANEFVGEEMFFKELKYSDFNPPVGQNKIKGDLMYLEIITLENCKLYITINKSGIFANKSSGSKFNAESRSSYFLNLIDLMINFSKKFQFDIEQYLDPNNIEVYSKYCNNYKIFQSKEWCISKTKITSKDKYLDNIIEILRTDRHGLNLTYYRDWNEEFINCLSIQNQNTIQQIQKIKILNKVQEDFKYAAEELAKAVVNQEILPLNISDKKMENCYVFNNLFATYAQETLNWEFPKTESVPSTYATINNDIKNLKYLNEMNIEGVNTINTCAVDYLGHRVIIQNVIQGILHFDNKTWNCYGSIDDGVTMNYNEEFHKIMEKVCEKFHLTIDNKFQDKEGKEYCFHGTPEVKGIKAGDGRNYIMDLMRLSIRDSNYEDKEKNECCVLRRELLDIYLSIPIMKRMEKQQLKQREEYLKKQQEELKKKQLEQEQKSKSKEIDSKDDDKKIQIKDKKQQKKEDKTKIVKTEEVKTKVVKTKEDKNKNKEVKTKDKEDNTKEGEVQTKEITTEDKSKQIEKEEDYVTKFNPSLLTCLESKNNLKYEDNKKLSSMITEKLIPLYIQTTTTNPQYIPLDMGGLIDQIHKNGINVRYLGRLHQGFKKINNKYMMSLLERSILVRSFVKYLRQLVFEMSTTIFLNIFIKKLNILLGSDDKRKQLDNKSKKKKKKNKNTFQQKQLNDLKHNKFYQEKSQDFINQLYRIAEQKYDFKFENLLVLDSQKDKMTFLREVCKKLGINLKQRNYKEFNLNIDDIANFHPIVKQAKYFDNFMFQNLQNIEYEIMKKNFQGAINIIKATQQMIMNTNGLKSKEFIIYTSKLAKVVFMQNKLDQAILIQNFVVRLSERVLGLDSALTGQAILELSNYYFHKNKIDICLKLHQRALFVFDLVGSELNPNSLFCLREIQVLFEREKKFELARFLMEELLKRNEKLFGRSDQRILLFLQKLADLNGKLGDFKQASLLQARHYHIFSKVISHPKINEQVRQNLKIQLEQSKKKRDDFVNKSKK